MDSKKLGEAYNRIADWWVNAQMTNPEYGMEYIRKSIKLSKPLSSVLDIGCGGTGRTVDEFLRNGFTVTGLDVSSEMIRLAESRHPDVRFIHEDFISWGTGDSFDLIIAWDSVFHTPAGMQRDITEKMCGLLNSGGILIFTAGSGSGNISGVMHGVEFGYGSIGYREYLDIIENAGCNIILMEKDQFSHDHMVFICRKP